jgi:Na+/melibiose symporter-like transporter
LANIIISPRSGQLSRIVLAALAGPSVPLAALSLPLVVYLPAYYSGSLGLSLSLVGTIFMLVRLGDICFDPVFGSIIDANRGKARYRIWLIIGAPLVMLGMGMLFMAKPGITGTYLALWLTVAYAGWSIVTLAQLALAANVSPDYNERARIYSWWQVAFLIGMLAVTTLPNWIMKNGGNPAVGMTAMAWFVIAITPIFVLITALVVRERDIPSDHAKSGLLEYFKLFKRPIVRQVIAVELLFGLAAGISSTLILFYFTQAKGIQRGDIGVIMISNFCMAMIASPLWAKLATKFGKHRALTFSGILYFIMQSAILFVPVGSLLFACIALGITGTTAGSISLLPRAMIADISDVERLDSGVDRTGIFFALLIGTWKLGQALSVGITFWALDFVGFSPKPGAINGEQAINGLMILYTVIPGALGLGAGLMIWNYPLTAERHAKVREALETKGQQSAEELVDTHLGGVHPAMGGSAS